MKSSDRHIASSLTAAPLVAVLALPQSLFAQTPSQHLVTSTDLQQATVEASQQRQNNVNTLNGFLFSDEGKRALSSAHIDAQKVQRAISGLSDAELSQLAARATKAQADFAAGGIASGTLLLILIGVAALILIIVIAD